LPKLNSSDTKSGKYWKPGSRYYGETKQRGIPVRKRGNQKGIRQQWYRRMTMAVNLRLTHAVKDRAVQHFRVNGSELLISFVDGSTMTVTIAECNSLPLREGAKISQISEDGAKLLFECEDDTTLDVTIVDPGNSVIVRDNSNQVEYLG
jgi:hypothetical protein